MSTHAEELLKRELEHLYVSIKDAEMDLKDLKRKYSQTQIALAKLNSDSPQSASISGIASGQSVATGALSVREPTLKEHLLGTIATNENGMTSKELAEIMMSTRPSTSENSVFSTLSRLKNESEIVKRSDGRWYINSKADTHANL